MSISRALAVAVVVVAVVASLPAWADLLTRADQEAYRAAFAAARANNWPAARDAAGRGHDALLGKTLHWLELTRSATAEFAEIEDFLQQNPEWPLAAILRERAELAAAEIPDAVLLPYFRQHEPTTPRAELRFAEMLAAAGEADRATALARTAWLRSAARPAALGGRRAAATAPASPGPGGAAPPRRGAAGARRRRRHGRGVACRRSAGAARGSGPAPR